MTAIEVGIYLAMFIAGCFFSYFLGQKDIIDTIKRNREKRQRWREFFDE